MRTKQKELREQEKAKQSAKRQRQMKVAGYAAVVAAAVVALPVVLVSALVCGLLQRWPDRLYTRATIAAAVLPALLALLLIGGYWEAYTVVWPGGAAPDTGTWLGLAVYGLAIGPLGGGIAARYVRRYREASPLSGPKAERKRVRAEDERKRTSAHRTQERAHTATPDSGQVARVRQQLAERRAVPVGDRRGPYLGRYLRGELDGWKSKRGYAQVPWWLCGNVHVEGLSQSGKSELVCAIEEWAMEYEGGQVVKLNCKQAAQGKEPSRRLLAHAEALGKSCNVLVPGYRPYDVMRGSPTEIRNRLMDVELFSEPHHEAGTNVVLAFGLHKLASEGRPADELADVLREIADRKRVVQWASHDVFAAKLLDMIDERSWAGAVQRYASDALDLNGWAGGASAGGFAIEDAQVSALDLPTSTEPKAAKMMLRLVLSDLEAYLSHPRRPKRADGSPVPLTIVLEELSALDSDPVIGRRVVNMMERALGSNVRFVIVTQDAGGIGDERTRDAVLSQTVISYRQGRWADEIASLAGTRQAAEASGTYSGRMGALRGSRSGSLRMQEQYAVHPNELRNLGRGECFIFHQGQFAKVAATMRGLGYGVPSSGKVGALDAELDYSRRKRSEETGMITGGGGMTIGEGEL
jgi:hypothetical protein